jgi:hypothetical protein
VPSNGRSARPRTPSRWTGDSVLALQLTLAPLVNRAMIKPTELTPRYSCA